jgi:hypothetical protein
LPVIVVVALGEPGVPVICWASAETQLTARKPAAASILLIFMAGTSR